MEIISRQDKNLLLNGSLCERDKELKDFFKIFNPYRGVTSEEVEKLEKTNERIYNLLKSEDSKTAIINNCKKEWIFKQPIGSKPFPCQLCGCTHSKDKFIITNKYTHKELKIGSSCIDQFPKEDRLLEGNDILEIREWSESQIERASIFYKQHKTGSIIFKNWAEQYKSLLLTTTEEMDKEFKRILNNGKTYYKKFIDNNLLEGNTINTFNYIIIDFEHFYKHCNKYINDNKNDLYICTKSMEKHLDKDIIKTIKKENAKITTNTAKNILDPEFISRFKKKIKNSFKSVGIDLKDISNDGIIINYTYGNYLPLNINLSLNNFANNYADIYFADKIAIKLDDILSHSTLTNTFDNIDRFLNILHSIIKDKKYYFNFDQKLHTEKTVEINKTGYNKYAIIDYEELLNEYFMVFSMDMNEAKEFLYNKIDSLTWIDKEEKKKYDVGNISKTTRNINKQNENEYNQYESEEEYKSRIKNKKKEMIKIN